MAAMAAARASASKERGSGSSKAAELDFCGGLTRNSKRLSAAQRTQKNKAKLKEMFRKHDVDGSRALDHGELRALLIDYSGKDVSMEDTTCPGPPGAVKRP